MPNRKVRSRSHIVKPVESQEKKLAKLEKLRLEYDHLKTERAQLREEVAGLDRKTSSGDISKKRHNNELRLKLARAGALSRRIAEVVGEMARLGKVPDGC